MNSDGDLMAGAGECLEKARSSAHGRNAHLVLHDGPLRQTLIALTAGSELAEHEAPPTASLHVLTGSVVLDGTTLHSGSLYPDPAPPPQPESGGRRRGAADHGHRDLTSAGRSPYGRGDLAERVGSWLLT